MALSYQQLHCLNAPERQALGQFIKEAKIQYAKWCRMKQVQEDCTGLQRLLGPILNERCECCDFITGAAATAEAMQL